MLLFLLFYSFQKRYVICCFRGRRWSHWLKQYATHPKVAGPIPDVISAIFHWHNPSGRTVALGLIMPGKEMSSKSIFWGVKAVCAQGWQPYHLHVSIVWKTGNIILLEPSWPVQACTWIALPIYLICSFTEVSDWWERAMTDIAIGYGKSEINFRLSIGLG